jgi:hypothetical protein
MGVNRWKAIVSLLCLAVWLPATHHCQLEKLPGLAFLHCPTDTPGNSDCQGDGCETVEKGFYKTSDNTDVALSAIILAVMPEAVEPAAPASVSCSSEVALISSPPRECCESWEYYSSRALAIRGPSLLS